jgi:hypothetical protein
VENTSLTDLARRVGDDLSALARDHLELARLELRHGVRTGVADTGAMILGGVVGLVGFAMLCASAVAALRPSIPALWLRLLIMAGVYILVGAVVTVVFGKQLQRPKMDETRKQTRRTAIALREQVTHGS